MNQRAPTSKQTGAIIRRARRNAGLTLVATAGRPIRLARLRERQRG